MREASGGVREVVAELPMRLSEEQYRELMNGRLRFGVQDKPKGKKLIEAKRTRADDIDFGSKHEAQRYLDLKLMQLAGEIFDLACHTSRPLVINGIEVGKYTDDFSYRDKRGELVIEDAKGYKTPMYRFRKKVFEACTGLKIVEV